MSSNYLAVLHYAAQAGAILFGGALIGTTVWATTFEARAREPEFLRRIRLLSAIRPVRPGWLVPPILLSAYLTPFPAKYGMAELWTRPQWIMFWATGFIGTASFHLYCRLWPRLRMGSSFITLEWEDRQTLSLHASSANRRRRGAPAEGQRSGRLAAKLMQRFGETFVSHGWTRVEMISPEIGEGALRVDQVGAVIRRVAPGWEVEKEHDRPFKGFRAVAYRLKRRGWPFPQRGRGIVLRYRGAR